MHRSGTVPTHRPIPDFPCNLLAGLFAGLAASIGVISLREVLRGDASTSPPPARIPDGDTPPSNMRRTMHASGWMYSSRALVFGWALLLTHQFGIHDYGIYAIAFAARRAHRGAARLVLHRPGSEGQPADLRRRAHHAGAHRARPDLPGMGAVAVHHRFLGGFAVGKAGVDVCFQASRSHLIRDGHPDRAQRADVARQVVGIALGTAYVLFFPGATISGRAGLPRRHRFADPGRGARPRRSPANAPGADASHRIDPR